MRGANGMSKVAKEGRKTKLLSHGISVTVTRFRRRKSTYALLPVVKITFSKAADQIDARICAPVYIIISPSLIYSRTWFDVIIYNL